MADGDALVLVGARPSGPDRLAGSRWAVECRGARRGTLGPLDLAAHAATAGLVASVVAEGVAGGDALASGVHDVSDGGLAVTLAEMVVARHAAARTAEPAPALPGATVTGVADHADLFAEVPGRFVVATARPGDLLARAAAAGVPAEVIGRAGGDRLVVTAAGGATLVDLAVGDLVTRFATALPDALGEPVP
jgi:phosphoribosylformylglycinamidine synthase